MRGPRQLVFRLFYSTTFTLLLLLEIILLLISPGDILYQSLHQERSWDIIIIAGVYALTLLVALFIIATRLYTTRTQLAGIPRTTLPIQDSSINKSVRKMISDGLSRSASIAYSAHPRELKEDELRVLEQAQEGVAATPERIPVRHMKAWLQIEHPGWSSPCSKEMPSLQYEPVILEFPNLLEAKAVSLAPPDPRFDPSSLDPSQLVPSDSVAISILQRPIGMPLREYVDRLISLIMLDDSAQVGDFLQMYEKARFSREPVYERDFRKLLSGFTIILQNLRAPSPELIEAMEIGRQSQMTSRTSTLPSSTTQSLESVIRAHSRATPSFKATPHTRRTSLKPGPASARNSPASATHTPFMTPKPTPYDASLSSGHAGDRSSDSSDFSDSERSAHTAFTRPGQRSRANTAPRYASASASAKRTPDVGTSASRISSRSTSSEHSIGSASVVRRVITGRSETSAVSGASDGSVIRREDRGEDVLPLPVAFIEEGRRDS